MSRILSLNLVDFAVRHHRRREPRSGDVLLLVVSTRAGRVVAHRSRAAAALGITPGMGEAQARARIGLRSDGAGATIAPLEPDIDARFLAELAQRALAFTPRVALDPPAGLLLDITGMQRVFGGEEALASALGAEFTALGFPVRIAVAESVGCAWALARHAPRRTCFVAAGEEREALSALDVAALRLAPEVLGSLAEVGIERVGEVLDLPRAQLLARFGADLGLRIDQALGRAFEPVEPVREAEPLGTAREFESPVGLGVVQAVLRESLGELVRVLARRGCGVRRLELRLDCADSAPIEESLVLSGPSVDAGHLAFLLELRLERAQLGFGVLALRLEVSLAAALPEEQREAFGGPARTGAAGTEADQRRSRLRAEGELIDVLSERLGARSVHAFEAFESHLPERAFRRMPALVRSQAHPGASPGPRFTHHARPSLVHANPLPTGVELDADAWPRRLSWGGEERRVVCVQGPERLESPWWLAPRGGLEGGHGYACESRDYYRVQDEAGRWLWLERGSRSGWCVRGEWA